MNIKLLPSLFLRIFFSELELRRNSKSRHLDKGGTHSRSMTNWRHRVKNPFGEHPFGEGHDLWILCVTFEDGEVIEQSVEKYEIYEQDICTLDWHLFFDWDWWETSELSEATHEIVDLSDEGLI